MDADEELSDWQSPWNEYLGNGRNENEKGKGKYVEESEETEEEDNQDLKDDDTLNEPNFTWNESKEAGWGRGYSKALKNDPMFGNGKKFRHHFCLNGEGFILQCRPSGDQNRVYILDGKIKIGGKSYCMRTLLIHAAHHRRWVPAVMRCSPDYIKERGGGSGCRCCVSVGWNCISQE